MKSVPRDASGIGAGCLPAVAALNAAHGLGTWTKIGAMGTHRDAHAAVRIGSRVLLIGGRTSPSGQTTRQTESYIPFAVPAAPAGDAHSNSNPAPAGDLLETRSFVPCVVLDSGLVLAPGGFQFSDGHYRTISSAELYNPSAEIWSEVKRGMWFARELHSATKLFNSQVLIAGGFSNKRILGSAELYDPAAATFLLTEEMLAPRFGHTATLLADGQVLVCGGRALKDISLQSCELFDPTFGFWCQGRNMTQDRFRHSATTLTDGRILIAGGYSSTLSTTLASAEIYDPNTGVFTPLASEMSDTRMDHTATLLKDDRVLIVGGWSSVKGRTVASADVFDPVTNRFSSAAPLPVSRHEHTATRLTDGTVLLTGGLRVEPAVQETLNDVYLYRP